MTTKLTKQERLYDVTQLAKAIFVAQAADIDFATIANDVLKLTIQDCFEAAELVIDHQEQRAATVSDA